MKKKIALTVLLGLLLGLAIYGIIKCAIFIIDLKESIHSMAELGNYFENEINMNIRSIVISSIFIVGFIGYLILCVYCIVHLWKFNLQYNFEAYKTRKDNKKACKKEIKIKRLENKIKNLKN